MLIPKLCNNEHNGGHSWLNSSGLFRYSVGPGFTSFMGATSALTI